MAGDAPQGHQEVQMPHTRFGSQLAHLEQSTKTNHVLNRTPLIGKLKISVSFPTSWIVCLLLVLEPSKK
jgi:hypothetical protein